MDETGGIDVHRLARRHWPVLRDVRLAALLDAPGAFLGDRAVEQARPAEAWQALCGDGSWLLAEVGGAPAGLVRGIRDPDSGDCYLESMWVAPAYRRRGVAGALVHAAAELARDQARPAMFLWVLDGNAATRAFYLGLGFVGTGRRQRIGPGGTRTEEEFRYDLSGAGGPGAGPAGAGDPAGGRFVA
jgi:ribosomal protein S18 acetylase RimI-like enzyme